MNNPFDGTFFKFLIGFVLILLVSFSIIYLAGKYKEGSALRASVDQGQSK